MLRRFFLFQLHTGMYLLANLGIAYSFGLDSHMRITLHYLPSFFWPKCPTDCFVLPSKKTKIWQSVVAPHAQLERIFQGHFWTFSHGRSDATLKPSAGGVTACSTSSATQPPFLQKSCCATCQTAGAKEVLDCIYLHLLVQQYQGATITKLIPFPLWMGNILPLLYILTG